MLKRGKCDTFTTSIAVIFCLLHTRPHNPHLSIPLHSHLLTMSQTQSTLHGPSRGGRDPDPKRKNKGRRDGVQKHRQEEWSENPATRTHTSGSQGHRRCACSTSTAAAIFATANSSLAYNLACPENILLSSRWPTVKAVMLFARSGNTISFSYIKFIRSNYPPVIILY